MKQELKVLVACEYSGRVRDAFSRRGWDAWSCDYEPTEIEGQHIQGDVTEILRQPWNLVIAHPPCTYLCNSGVRWLYKSPNKIDWDRIEKVKAGAEFFRACYNSNTEHVAVENPVMHGVALRYVNLGKANFSFQPWQLGALEKKRTCIWSQKLPPLKHSVNTIPAEVRQSVFLASPGPDRWKERSRTLPKVAEAFASQWGNYIENL